MNYEEFIEKFKPINNKIEGEFAALDGKLFSLSKEEMDFVKIQVFNRIWTVVEEADDKSGRQWYIIDGVRITNRIGFLITEEPWDNKNYEILIDL